MLKIVGLLAIITICVFFIQRAAKLKEPQTVQTIRKIRMPVKIPVGKVLAVDGNEFKTIQAAIDNANLGDIVRIKSGIYDESLVIKDGVSLVGEDGNSVIIQCDMRVAPVLTINNCENVQIEKLTLKHYNPIPVESDSEGQWPVVKIDDSTAVLDNLIVCDSAAQGITINNGSRADERVWVTGCTIYNNHSYGILVSGSGKVNLKNNTCINNKRNGIYLMDDSNGIISGNVCASNGHHGISIGNNAGASVFKNMCCKNKWSGVCHISTGVLEVKDNNCSDNDYAGIVVESRAEISAVENTCRHNGSNGIYFGKGACGNISENICAENKWNGISIDEDSRPNVANNKCFRNKRCGIYDDGFMPGMNEIYDNNEFCWQEIHIYFRAEDFNRLEKMASKIRNEKRRFRNGSWQLENFYSAFERRYSHQSVDDIIQLLEKWSAACPNSVTPRIGLAVAMRTKAWEIRGGGYANTVSPNAWDDFKKNLLKAHDVLKEAEKLDARDPDLYAEWIYIAMALGEIEDMNIAFQKGVAIEPTYFPLYYYYGFAYLPKWYGKPGQYHQIAVKAADSTKDKIGDSLYFLFACEMTHQVKDVNEFKESGFDYSRVKQGQKDFVKQFPDSLDAETRNRLCFMACAAGEKEDARDYFMDIGDGWNEKVWRNSETFEKYKAWARNRE